MGKQITVTFLHSKVARLGNVYAKFLIISKIFIIHQFCWFFSNLLLHVGSIPLHLINPFGVMTQVLLPLALSSYPVLQISSQVDWYSWLHWPPCSIPSGGIGNWSHLLTVKRNKKYDEYGISDRKGHKTIYGTKKLI